jgi:hypothetical protein
MRGRQSDRPTTGVTTAETRSRSLERAEAEAAAAAPEVTPATTRSRSADPKPTAKTRNSSSSASGHTGHTGHTGPTGYQRRRDPEVDNEPVAVKPVLLSAVPAQTSMAPPRKRFKAYAATPTTGTTPAG